MSKRTKKVETALPAKAAPQGKEKTADVNRSQLLLAKSFKGYSPVDGKEIQLTVGDLGLQFTVEQTRANYMTDNVLRMAQGLVLESESMKTKSVKRTTVLAAAHDAFKAVCTALELSMKWGKAEKGSDKETRESFHAAPKTYANVKSIINQSFKYKIDIAKFDHVSGLKGLEVTLQATKVAARSAEGANDGDGTETAEAAPNAAESAIDNAIASEVSPELVAMVESVLALGQKLPEGQCDEMVAAVALAIEPFKDIVNILKEAAGHEDETPRIAGAVS